MTAQPDPPIQHLVQIEQEIERLLLENAEAGIPELVLVAVLRDYADIIDELGFVPRTWRGSRDAEHAVETSP